LQVTDHKIKREKLGLRLVVVHHQASVFEATIRSNNFNNEGRPLDRQELLNALEEPSKINQ